MPIENGQQGTDNRYPEELRQKIDQGEGADKVDALDPAAAPLGTDGEASGYSSTTEETKTAIEHEIEPVSQEAQGPAHATDSYFVETDWKRAAVTFSVATVLVVIALAAIYSAWPH
jgi:hypothetical protein